MLRHGLEAVRYALEKRLGMLLPQGADAEEIARLQEAWTYAVVTAALLHDIGKPLTDMVVELVDGRKVLRWSPWRFGTLLDTGFACYRIRYRKRAYRFHERLGLLLAERMLPAGGLEWLAGDDAIFTEWTAFLAGHHADSPTLNDIVQPADQRSVAEDLGNERPPAAESRTVPLAERLVTALRHLIDEGIMPLNRDGAAGWMVDGDLWLVAKRGLDEIRDHMNREGQTGVPGRNERLMDELQQHGWLVPNGDRAVWKARVFAEGWRKAHELTFLRFQAARIWTHPETRPEPFEGSLKVLEQDAEKTREAPVRDEPAPLPEPPMAETGEGDEARPARDEESLPLPDLSAASADPLPEPPTPLEESPPEPEGESVARSEPEAGENPSPTSTEASAPDNPGQAFLNWLRAGLRDRRFQVNNRNARIHVVSEGLLLVSPGIFKDFDREAWSKAQKRFQRLKVNLKTPSGHNIWTYEVTGELNKEKPTRLKGFLIQDIETVLPNIHLPAPNPHLTLVPPREKA